MSVDLVGVFNGPDGSAIVVKGFWDGGKTFRIRFTPTVEGPWTFMTVSDDPGLDAHQGILTCVKPKAGLHGFVRLLNDVQGAWKYDDGSALRDDVLTVTVAENTAGRLRADNADGPATEPGRDGVDVGRMEAADRLVREALAGGRPVALNLFDAGAASQDDSRAYRFLEYVTARCSAFTNVMWCLHPASATDRDLPFWRTVRSLVPTLDPYFAQGARVRVLKRRRRERKPTRSRRSWTASTTRSSSPSRSMRTPTSASARSSA